MAEKEPPVDCLGPNARSGKAFQRQLTALEIKGGELISTHSTISTALKWEDCTTGEAEDTYYAEKKCPKGIQGQLVQYRSHQVDPARP